MLFCSQTNFKTIQYVTQIRKSRSFCRAHPYFLVVLKDACYRPVWVKRFRTIHHSRVDVAHALVLLFAIGLSGVYRYHLPWRLKITRMILEGCRHGCCCFGAQCTDGEGFRGSVVRSILGGEDAVYWTASIAHLTSADRSRWRAWLVQSELLWDASNG